MKHVKVLYFSVLMVVIFFAGITQCRKRGRSEEDLFKKNAKAFDKVELSMMRSMRSKMPIEFSMDFSHLSLDSSLVKRNKKKLLEIARNFEEFIQRHPDSKWSDDAGVCLVHLYSIMSLPFRVPYCEKAISNSYDFLRNYPHTDIEPWTIENNRIIGSLWASEHNPSVQRFNEILRESMYANIIEKAYVCKGVKGVKTEYEKMKKLGFKGEIIAKMPQIIKRYEGIDKQMKYK